MVYEPDENFVRGYSLEVQYKRSPTVVQLEPNYNHSRGHGGGGGGRV